jgi:MFS family permease
MSVGSLLQSELAPPRHRGLMVGLVGVMISIGYVFANWLGVAFYFVEASGAQWRIPFAICTVPSFLTISLLPLIPESPRWLVMKGRTEEARKALLKLHGHSSDEGHEFAELEIKQMVDQISFEQDHQMGWWALCTSKRYRTRFILTVVTQSMSQVSSVFSQMWKEYLNKPFLLVGWNRRNRELWPDNIRQSWV